MAEFVDDADFVYHLAAAVGVQLIVDSPVRTIETNVHCTEIVLAQAGKKRRPVFIASTSEVYGKSAAVPFREDGDIVMGATTRGRWAYACSKALDEFLAIAYYRERGLPTVIGRLFNTVGPRQTGRYGMVLPTFVRQALAGQPITVFGSGEQRRCFCHVRDVVAGARRHAGPRRSIRRGVQHRLHRGGLDPRAGAASQRNHRNELRASLFIPYDEAYGEGFEDMNRRVPDTTKIGRALGWRPTLALDEIITDVVRHARGAVQTAAQGAWSPP